MNIRFFNARILTVTEDKIFSLTDGELWVQGNKILYIGDGKDKDLEKKSLLWDREIDAEGNVLMPGFKNAHTHTAMTFLRSFADDLPLQEWLHNKVFPMEAKLTHEAIYNFCRLGILEYFTSGITTGFDMYIDPVAIARAAKDCGFRMMQTSGLNDFTQSLQAVEEQYYQINEMSSLTGFVLGFHAEYTTGKNLMEGLASLAQRLKSPVWLHNAETAKEVAECKGRYGMTPTQITDTLGMYTYGGGGYHCIYLEDKDFEIYKKRGLSAVTCPASNLKLASGMAPVKRFLDEGISVAIGTDGAASNNCLDMFREMFLVTGLAKIKEADAACVMAEDVLYMATTGGARAMGLKACDSLEEGKLADIIMIDIKQPNMQPEHNLFNNTSGKSCGFVKNLVYSGSKQNVLLTMIDGKILYEKNKFDISIDVEEIYSKANASIRRMTT